jgi:hypothetical protein
MLRVITATVTVAAGMSLGVIPSAALAQRLVPCAQEDGYCRVPYPTSVIYGVPGRSTAIYVRAGGVPCSNEVFGDPAPYVRKRCAYVARGYTGPEDDDEGDVLSWRPCAREGGFCDFGGRKRVRYGANGRFFEGIFRNGVYCDNSTFGDPAYGVRKSCQVLE